MYVFKRYDARSAAVFASTGWVNYLATLKGAPTKNETGGAPIPGSGKGTNHGGPQAAEKPAGSAATKQKPRSMHEHPNVLFIAIDDLR
ncbi:MAG TPA: hypothetical protein QF564_24135, partial [Pirellulaceae bacterium]|nr:hypothetical protein [Pirellulaceae bacterium]